MPKKRDDRTYGEKLMYLFGRLFFMGGRYSLTQLSEQLNCSKQTVQRLIDDIVSCYGVEIEPSWEGNRKFFGMKKLSASKTVKCITDMEINLMQMCQAFAVHLLGADFLEKTNQGILKSSLLLSEAKTTSRNLFSSHQPGNIDYTPHQKTINTLVEAMGEAKVCKVTYQSGLQSKPKSYYLKPLVIFSHNSTLYLHAQLAKAPGQKYKEPAFDPVLLIHRFKVVKKTDRIFEFPLGYRLEKVFDKNFGLIQDKPFTVTVEFTGWAARYVSERTWSKDQIIRRKKGGGIELSLTTTSQPEVISWLLSFGPEAKLVRPAWLVKEIRAAIDSMTKRYMKQ